MIVTKSAMIIRPIVADIKVGFCRKESTLADRMKRAAAAAASGTYESEEEQRHRLEEQVDEQVRLYIV